MLAAILISLREGLEAALIVGIMFSYLRKTGQPQYRRYLWYGVIAAVLVSVGVALGLTAIGASLEGPAEPIFEGVMMLIAVVVLTWMIFWMRSQARSLKLHVESGLDVATRSASPWGLFAVAFFAVVREGVETALLLTATAFVTGGAETLAGTVIGLTVAVAIGYLVYASALKLNMRTFFNVTSILLLLFAAGLFASSIHEFQEAGVLPLLTQPAWDTTSLLPEDSTVGLLLKTLFGYSSTPTPLMLIGYAGYWVFALVGIPWLVNRTVRRETLIPADSRPAA